MVATVNGVGILAAEFGAALDRYALSRGGSLVGRDSTLVLDSLIDEELLVQRARDLRIDRNDRLVRDLMAKTVVEVVAMEAESTDPTAEEIAAFYEAERGAVCPRGQGSGQGNQDRGQSIPQCQSSCRNGHRGGGPAEIRR